ncbi:type II secretion system F family protein [Vibrio splendidus]|nr:type II secretion system F family protein [Vibrio splendidus]MCC4881499.1 type II secretion system F family protein [Vibrio splendidus]
MKTFSVVIEHRGKLLVKDIEANDQFEAKKIGKQFGKVVSCKKVFSLGRFEPPFETTDRQIFLQRLAAMTGSKMPVSESLALMESTFKGKIKKVSSRILKQITAGKGLSDAIDSLGAKEFPPTTVALIKAGIIAGDTATALRNAADFEVEMDRIKRESGSGIGSALGGFVSAVGITFGTTRYMGPQTLESDLMDVAGDSINVDWAITLGHACEILMGLTTLFFFFLWALNNWGRRFAPLFVDKIILRVPYYKDLALAKNSYIALYGLSMLTKSDVRMQEALHLAGTVAEKGQLQQELLNSSEAIGKGAGSDWAMELKSLHPTDIAALSASEDRKNIAVSLDAISLQYKNLYGARVRMLAPILQGISVIFICLGGAVLFGQTMVPMMQFATADLN